MRQLVFIFLLLSSGLLTAQRDTIFGDLDGDGQPEMAVLTHYPPGERTDEYGEDTMAKIVVLRKIAGRWRIWKDATGPAMIARGEAGFSRLWATIDRRALVIVHGSGGYTNLEYTHRFRWQNGRFELIGATYYQNERCTGGERFDYNLCTGDFEVEEWYDRCETESTDNDEEDELPPKPYFSRTGKVLELRRITLDNFVPGQGVAKLPALGVRYF